MTSPFDVKRLSSVPVITLCTCISLTVFGQQSVKKTGTLDLDDPKIAQQQELVARLIGIANELKGEVDKPRAAVLQSEIADVLWKFDEPTARSIFRLAFDSIRQDMTDSASSKSGTLIQTRRRISALRLILKRYAIRDRKGADVWLQEFENEIKSKQIGSDKNSGMSSEQAELLSDIALSLISTNPKEAARLGVLSLSGSKVPSGFGRLLMALRERDKALSDVVFRQALLSMRSNGFPYDSALFSLGNYAFFSNGARMPDLLPADVGLIIQFFVEASSAHAARSRSEAARSNDEQSALGSFYSFLNNRALPIVTINAPEKAVLLHSNVAEIGRALTLDQRQQAEALASLTQSNANKSVGNDSDPESRIRCAEQEKNVRTRDSLFRNLALQLMRSEPGRALEVAGRIDDKELRAQTEDDVNLILMSSRSLGPEATAVALKFNDPSRRAKWLTKIAGKLLTRSKDQTEPAELLSNAYSIAMKGDNAPVKLDVLLLIAKEFLRFDSQRGFEVLTDAVNTANRLEDVPAKANKSPATLMRIVSITVVDGEEVSTDDRVTVDSIDFNQISTFVERDYLRTNFLGNDIKDRFSRSKYFIAVARSVLQVPRQGAGYERTFEDVFSN